MRACCLLFLLLPGLVCASPSALNLIPTADTMDEGTFNVQFESAGTLSPFRSDATLYVLTQATVAPGLEIGLDAYDVSGQTDWLLNAKWRFQPETEHRPALALGVGSLGDTDSHETVYFSASRDLSKPRIRATSGVFYDGHWRWMVGFDHYFNDRLGVLLDWMTGPEAYAALGLTYAVTPELWLTPYYGLNNTSGSEDFFALNLYWSGQCR